MSNAQDQPETDGQSQAPQREVAHRTFAREFNDATHTFKESDDDRAPVYALLPTGVKANRVFIVGTLTETEDVGSDSEYWQGRIVDPTGTVFVYAGQYQPDTAALLRELDPPAFVAVVGKPRTYETDDDSVNVSLRPEHLTVVDEATRQCWVTDTARQTLDRIEAFSTAGTDYTRLAQDQYGDDLDPYRQAVIEAMESLDTTTTDTDTGTTAPASANGGAVERTGATSPTADTTDDQQSDTDGDGELGDFTADTTPHEDTASR
jgi:RPA family protein